MMNFLEGSLYREIMDRVNNVENVEGALQMWANQVDTKLNPLATADLISRCGTMETNITNLQNNKQDKFTGTTSQYVRGNGSLASFPSIPAAQINSDWDATTGVAQIVNKPKKIFAFKATVSGGNAVFYLTKDGTAGGVAFFTNGPDLDSLQITPEEGTTPHYPGTPVLSNSNKTLTVPITKSGVSFLSLLGLNVLTGSPVAANGSIIRMMIAGA